MSHQRELEVKHPLLTVILLLACCNFGGCSVKLLVSEEAGTWSPKPLKISADKSIAKSLEIEVEKFSNGGKQLENYEADFVIDHSDSILASKLLSNHLCGKSEKSMVHFVKDNCEKSDLLDCSICFLGDSSDEVHVLYQGLSALRVEKVYLVGTDDRESITWFNKFQENERKQTEVKIAGSYRFIEGDFGKVGSTIRNSLLLNQVTTVVVCMSSESLQTLLGEVENDKFLSEITWIFCLDNMAQVLSIKSLTVMKRAYGTCNDSCEDPNVVKYGQDLNLLYKLSNLKGEEDSPQNLIKDLKEPSDELKAIIKDVGLKSEAGKLVTEYRFMNFEIGQEINWIDVNGGEKVVTWERPATNLLSLNIFWYASPDLANEEMETYQRVIESAIAYSSESLEFSIDFKKIDSLSKHTVQEEISESYSPFLLAHSLADADSHVLATLPKFIVTYQQSDSVQTTTAQKPLFNFSVQKTWLGRGAALLFQHFDWSYGCLYAGSGASELLKRDYMDEFEQRHIEIVPAEANTPYRQLSMASIIRARCHVIVSTAVNDLSDLGHFYDAGLSGDHFIHISIDWFLQSGAYQGSFDSGDTMSKVSKVLEGGFALEFSWNQLNQKSDLAALVEFCEPCRDAFDSISWVATKLEGALRENLDLSDATSFGEEFLESETVVPFGGHLRFASETHDRTPEFISIYEIEEILAWKVGDDSRVSDRLMLAEIDPKIDIVIGKSLDDTKARTVRDFVPEDFNCPFYSGVESYEERGEILNIIPIIVTALVFIGYFLISKGPKIASHTDWMSLADLSAPFWKNFAILVEFIQLLALIPGPLQPSLQAFTVLPHSLIPHLTMSALVAALLGMIVILRSPSDPKNPAWQSVLFADGLFVFYSYFFVLLLNTAIHTFSCNIITTSPQGHERLYTGYDCEIPCHSEENQNLQRWARGFLLLYLPMSMIYRYVWSMNVMNPYDENTKFPLIKSLILIGICILWTSLRHQQIIYESLLGVIFAILLAFMLFSKSISPEKIQGRLERLQPVLLLGILMGSFFQALSLMVMLGIAFSLLLVEFFVLRHPWSDQSSDGLFHDYSNVPRNSQATDIELSEDFHLAQAADFGKDVKSTKKKGISASGSLHFKAELPNLHFCCRTLYSIFEAKKVQIPCNFCNEGAVTFFVYVS